MKFLGVGLSKTGTSSVHAALQQLGFKSLHYDHQRLNDVLDGSNPHPTFRRYDDVDAVFDLPAACFHEELMQAYPDLKCILTIRDEAGWWRSIERHFNQRWPVSAREQDPLRFDLRTLAYGSSVATEFLYRKKYREHNERVRRTVPPDRLLVLDVIGGDGWEKLCPFVGCEIPGTPFPRANVSPQGGPDHLRELYLANQEINALIPSGEPFVLVDEQWWQSELTRRAWAIPFTEKDGDYWGPPADDLTAIQEFERLRGQGARFAVIAYPAFWWLDHYRRFHEHLRTTCRCISENQRMMVFELAPATPNR